MTNNFSRTDLHFHRKSIRLQGYDYSQSGMYFITICAFDHAHLFGKIENDAMILNPAGWIVYDEWIKTPEIRSEMKIHEFIVMPNHFHAIVGIISRRATGWLPPFIWT